MNLFAIRRRFRDLSGRYDLADDDPDNTITFIINQACRYLDRLTEHQKSWGVHYVEADVDDFKVSIPYCRSIKEVWMTTTEARWQLEKISIQDLIVDYLSGDDVESGASAYYSPTITRRIPDGVDITAFAAYMTYMDTSTDLDFNHNAVVFTPPTDEKVLVEVRGFFYSKELTLETDENYWTTVHPLTLLKAAMRELEVFNQNQSKVEAWDRALAIEIDNINKDLVEEIVAEVSEIDN